MDLPFIADLLPLQNKWLAGFDWLQFKLRELQVIEFLQSKNGSLGTHAKSKKVGKVTCNPFMIEKLHCNGAITICSDPNVVDHINIWNIWPVKQVMGNHKQVKLNL